MIAVVVIYMMYLQILTFNGLGEEAGVNFER